MLQRSIIRTTRTAVIGRRFASTDAPAGSKATKGVLARRVVTGVAAGFGVAVVRDWWTREQSAVQCESESPKPPKPTHFASPTDDPLIFNRTTNDQQAETFTRQAAENAKKTLKGFVGGVKDTVEGVVGHGRGEDAHQPGRVQEYDDPKNPMRIRMSTWVMALQDHIVQGLEQLEASVPPNTYNASPTAPTFHRDHWLRPQGGEGSSCVLANGRVFEKAGVNVSVVHGVLPPAAIRQMKADHKSLVVDGTTSLPFFAAGISIVLHPWNPHAPTVHLNYRYFEVDPPATSQDSLDVGSAQPSTREPLAWWFGGGSDLTPSYLYPEDAAHFHNTLKRAADAHDERYFPVWKKWCDKYFYIPHRGESRGVGGIFFDDLTSSSEVHAIGKEAGVVARTVSVGKDELERIKAKIESILPSGHRHAIGPTPAASEPTANDIFRLVQTMSSSFLDSYVPIMQRRIHMPYTEEERRWQLLRRGRYVEFNLVHDRGTKFGLFTPGARIESILMSLPQTARWEYMSDMGAEGSGTREEELMKVLKNPRDWADV